ncbi:MAG: SGNH/GDSL hydrolase family protein [Lachnospiraceae bacterium]|nr:SGNH/GDSL hydrolase family protein [Lachnospiraceae bacterium]
MSKGKIVLIIAGGVLCVLAVSALCILGSWGMGPLSFINDRKVAKMPGNGDSYDFSQVQTLEETPLTGKTVCFLGSSVTFGSAAMHYSLPEYFSQRTGCTVIKEAVSGTTLVDNGSNSYVQRLKNNIDKNASIDLLVCQLSTNDATVKNPLGTLSAETSGFDTSTVTGAMEEIISYAEQTWGCPVVFFTGAHYDSAEYDAMVARTYELADKWGIGVLDLWNNSDFNDISDEDRALYMNDEIHPTKAGYLLWWCPELEYQLFEYLAQ